MTAHTFPPTRAAGLARMAKFQPSMGRHYANTRNHDYGPDDRSNLSLLSPYIRHRLVTENEVANAALSRFSLSSTEKFVQEICWRTYWKGWLEHRPGVWQDYLETRNAAFDLIERNSGEQSAYQDAIHGRTGIAVFDAWARELVETGYLANHSRMWFSSIWIYTLKLPWELGADFFLQHLMDGDPASNTCSWRWTGGLHTQGKTYLARPDNIAKYAGQRFEREIGTDWTEGLDRLAETALPVEGRPNPGLSTIPAPDRIPEGLVGLLLTEQDLHPISLLSDRMKVVAIGGACFPDDRSPAGAGQVAKSFTQRALAGALEASASDYGVASSLLSSDETFADAALTWAQGLETTHIVTAEPTTGWVKARLLPLKTTLADHGLTLSFVRREWDETFWPHARKGFFGLKKKIPEVLAQIRLPV